MLNISKNSDRGKQKKRVFREFHKGAFTMFMMYKMTGVLRSTICGYVDEWKKQGIIYEVKKALCPYTKHAAGFYTTNKELYENFKTAKTLNKPYYNKG